MADVTIASLSALVSKVAEHSDLPVQHSFITTHSPDGASIFLPEDRGISKALQHKAIGSTKSRFADLHTCPSVPVTLHEDLQQTKNEIAMNKLAAGVIPNGASFRRTDKPPGGVSPMHKTLTLDYGAVIAGAVELILESGEKRIMKVGDTIVQRATMHMWRNASDEEEWCRMVWVQMPIQNAEVGGKKLEEEYRMLTKPPG